jgi:antitoxin (DNA-binding transcriptional repressor) of toxin-antitoxin stability system
MLDRPSELTISATAFKAQCLALMDDVQRGRLKRVIVTKRGKPVAELGEMKQNPAPAKVSIIGCLKDEFDWDEVEREMSCLSQSWPTTEELDAKFQRLASRDG